MTIFLFFGFRTLVVVEHRAISRLTDILNVILHRSKKTESGIARTSFPEEELLVTLDILKALFNTLCIMENRDQDEEETSLLLKLCQILQTFILVEISTGERKFDLVG